MMVEVTVGCTIKANPFIAAVRKTSFADIVLMAKKSIVMFSKLDGIEKMTTRTDTTKQAMAKGVALRTYLRLGR